MGTRESAGERGGELGQVQVPDLMPQPVVAENGTRRKFSFSNFNTYVS